MNVSVAMASYNGSSYIEEQIKSIVSQLQTDDELVISDDGSTDNTLTIVQSLITEYPQIKLFSGPREGIFRNFENAMLQCKNEIIILSDQDDIWIEGKVNLIRTAFEQNKRTNVVMHSAYVMNGSEKTVQKMVQYRRGFIKNWLKSCYWGCCMAIRASFLSCCLPFPSCCIAHDQLIGLLSERCCSTVFLDVPLIYHRFHKSNATRKRSLKEKIQFRIRLLKGYILCQCQKKRRLLAGESRSNMGEKRL